MQLLLDKPHLMLYTLLETTYIKTEQYNLLTTQPPQNYSGVGTAAALDDEITIIAHNIFSVADAPTLSGGGTFAASIRAPIYDTTQNTMKTALFQTNEQSMVQTQQYQLTNASCNDLNNSG